jgi:4-carboxymuconolactone decarboxylase
VPRALIDALARGERPPAMADDEAAVYDVCTELQRERRLCDATWAKGLALFGEQGVVDLMAVNGYYALLAMVMNGARTRLA